MNTIDANIRNTNTKGEINSLRTNGKVPAIVYGGSDSQFTSFLIEDTTKSYLNLKLNEIHPPNFGRIIFYVDNVDELFAYMENDGIISSLGKLESKPEDAEWGERFFHALDPDGYKLSFATPI